MFSLAYPLFVSRYAAGVNIYSAEGKTTTLLAMPTFHVGGRGVRDRGIEGLVASLSTHNVYYQSHGAGEE